MKTLAGEGGLPASLVADPEGRPRQVVRGLMQDIIRVGRERPPRLTQLAGRRAEILQLGFRSDEFIGLLTDFCCRLDDLERDPRQIPGTRRGRLAGPEPTGHGGDALPLRLDDAGARSLLDDAMTAEMKAANSLLLSRELVRDGDRWLPYLTVSNSAEVPAWLFRDAESLKRFRLMPERALDQASRGLVLSADRDEDIWTVRRESAGRTGRFPFRLGDTASFLIMAEGQRFGSHVPLGGAALGLDGTAIVWAPDLSRGGEDASVRLRKLGSASTRSRASALWVMTADTDTPRFSRVSTPNMTALSKTRHCGKFRAAAG